jgi:hypothetical protein
MNTQFAILLCALSAVANSVASPKVDSPNLLVKQFLEWEAREQPSGVYRGIRTPELDALLSTELQCLLDAAIAANETSKRLSPDEKPPFIEGNIFLPVAWERPLNTEIRASRSDGDRSSVEVSFQYQPNGLKFISRFWLSRQAGVWKIIDITLGGECDFCQKGKLRDALYGTLRHYSDVNANSCKKIGS